MRGHKRKIRTISDPNRNAYVATCEVCGKKGFDTRKLARAAARKNHPGEPLSTYLCERGLWHYGHLGVAVRNGSVPRVIVEVRSQRRLGIRREGLPDAE